MANEAPERIWTDDECHYETRNPHRSHAVEYIRADLATLSSGQARDALTELAQLWDRVKELEKALEPFAKAAQDLDETAQDRHDIWEHPVAVSITVAHLRAARRVREGGKG